MKKRVALSQAELVLLAIYRASNRASIRIPFEEIVIRAWKDFPNEFSLNNYPQYPDSYPVSKRLTSDLITGRLVISVSKEFYKLTEKGLESAKEIEDKISGEEPGKVFAERLLNREQQEIIKYTSRTRTFSSWKQGKKDDLIDFDARMFFQFSTGTALKERKRRVETVKEAIDRAVSLKVKEADALKELCDFLVQKFSYLLEEG